MVRYPNVNKTLYYQEPRACYAPFNVLAKRDFVRWTNGITQMLST
jgi:hypothetical protein